MIAHVILMLPSASTEVLILSMNVCMCMRGGEKDFGLTLVGERCVELYGLTRLEYLSTLSLLFLVPPEICCYGESWILDSDGWFENEVGVYILAKFEQVAGLLNDRISVKIYLFYHLSHNGN